MIDLCFILNLCFVIQFLTKHLGYQLYSRKLLDLIFSDQLTVTKNRDPVADFIYLIQEMCYKDNSYTSGSKISHKLKQLLYLFVIERRCRLIKNQHFTIHIYGSGDRYHLLDCDGTAGELLCGLSRDIERLQDLVCIRIHFLPILAHALGSSDKHIFCNGQVRAEGNLLIHSTDSEILCILWGMDLHRFIISFQENLSTIFFIHTGQHLDQRGFTGSILTHKSVDFAFTQGEINRLQCLYSCKVFMNIFHL